MRADLGPGSIGAILDLGSTEAILESDAVEANPALRLCLDLWCTAVWDLSCPSGRPGACVSRCQLALKGSIQCWGIPETCIWFYQLILGWSGITGHGPVLAGLAPVQVGLEVKFARNRHDSLNCWATLGPGTRVGLKPGEMGARLVFGMG